MTLRDNTGPIAECGHPLDHFLGPDKATCPECVSTPSPAVPCGECVPCRCRQRDCECHDYACERPIGGDHVEYQRI